MEKIATNGKMDWRMNESKTAATNGAVIKRGLITSATTNPKPEADNNADHQLSDPITMAKKAVKKNPIGKHNNETYPGMNTIENGILSAYSKPSILAKSNMRNTCRESNMVP